jgi:hypothetical protein
VVKKSLGCSAEETASEVSPLKLTKEVDLVELATEFAQLLALVQLATGEANEIARWVLENDAEDELTGCELGAPLSFAYGGSWTITVGFTKSANMELRQCADISFTRVAQDNALILRHNRFAVGRFYGR